VALLTALMMSVPAYSFMFVDPSGVELAKLGNNGNKGNDGADPNQGGGDDHIKQNNGKGNDG
jgi:hypothetical protein